MFIIIHPPESIKVAYLWGLISRRKLLKLAYIRVDWEKAHHISAVSSVKDASEFSTFEDANSFLQEIKHRLRGRWSVISIT